MRVEIEFRIICGETHLIDMVQELAAVHLMLKDQVYDGTNGCAHPDAYIK